MARGKGKGRGRSVSGSIGHGQYDQRYVIMVCRAFKRAPASDDEHSYHGEDRWSDSDEEFDADLEMLKETPRLPSSLSSPSSVGDQLSSPSSVGDQLSSSSSVGDQHEALDAALDAALAAVSKAATEVKAAADAKTAAEDVSVQHEAIPVITELDKMDEDQSSPNLDMVMLDPDLNIIWPVALHYSRPSSYSVA